MSNRLAIIGYGTVGSGVYEALIEKQAKVEGLVGNFSIPVIVVKDPDVPRKVSSSTIVTTDFTEIFKQKVDTAVEATPDAETAYPIVKELLENGITVITANKELVAKYGEELLYTAALKNCRFYFEAAVAGGIPILTSVRHALKTNTIEKVEGIVNGTSNFILTKMRDEGTAFNEALKQAQEFGYAEAVPDKDIDGWDAWYKTTILSHWLYGKPPEWQEEKPKGIRDIDVRDLHLADVFGGRVKHVASLEGTKAAVEPRLILADHALYGVEGVNNGVHVQGSISGSLLFQGAGAGKFPTASAVIEDIVNHWTNTAEAEPPQLEEEVKPKEAETFPYWFITGSGLENLPNRVTDIEIVEGREGTIIEAAKSEAVKFGEAVYPVSGTLKKILVAAG
ncbi:homoserine dehydrogenase [Alkalicoccus daliensis]|uniref:Homoserine dehydrogenase n=1 Tax=Alkalicoccus daliensis TaxID=745820 RepID=A0A1H0JCI5_9BACI|nr:homoserine dehydrogenase [Alkalicoccus daliensis]SDO41447.1 homoserine dehydrogenase [Alkalicoccus daliensis]